MITDVQLLESFRFFDVKISGNEAEMINSVKEFCNQKNISEGDFVNSWIVFALNSNLGSTELNLKSFFLFTNEYDSLNPQKVSSNNYNDVNKENLPSFISSP